MFILVIGNVLIAQAYAAPWWSTKIYWNIFIG
jgi:hypothetical protein